MNTVLPLLMDFFSDFWYGIGSALLLTILTTFIARWIKGKERYSLFAYFISVILFVFLSFQFIALFVALSLKEGGPYTQEYMKELQPLLQNADQYIMRRLIWSLAFCVMSVLLMNIIPHKTSNLHQLQ